MPSSMSINGHAGWTPGGFALGSRRQRGAGMSTRKNLPPLDGLRGTACMCVLFDHFSHWSAPWDERTTPYAKGFWILTGSDYGMTLFFTLSGFVIAYNYLSLDWADRPLRSCVDFGYRRFSRLYPLLCVFFVACLIGHRNADVDGHTAWAIMNLLGTQSWLPTAVAGTLASDGTFFVAWSLSAEFMLYALFALAMMGSARMSRPAIGAAMVTCAGAMAIVSVLVAWSSAPPFYLFEPLTADQWHAWFFYVSPWGRLAQFGLGWGAAWFVLNRSAEISRHRAALRFAGGGAAAAVAATF